MKKNRLENNQFTRVIRLKTTDENLNIHENADGSMIVEIAIPASPVDVIDVLDHLDHKLSADGVKQALIQEIREKTFDVIHECFDMELIRNIRVS